ncbi:alpha/beta hydrolase [Parasphingorhabdus sp.]|uniref:alpha/beta hydrolase n=1 Tax=Parasphingorhabdus sp. TaxID=2709688 RepID=UPI0035930E08
MADLTVRDDVRNFLDMLEQMGGKAAHEGTPTEARQAFNMLTPLADLPPEELAVIADMHCDGPAGRIPLRYYDARADRGDSPVILFIHGGGFVIGDLESHHPFCTSLAKELDLPVVAVDYRLAPEHPFPAAPDDCEAAARWVASNPKALPFKPTGIITCGDSAGGNLAIVTTIALRDEPADVPVIAQFPLYPVVDSGGDYESFRECAEGFLLTSETMAWFGKQYAAEIGHERNDVIHLPHANMPPTVIVTASLDPLRDQGKIYAAKLREVGVPVREMMAEGNIHGFICLRKAIPSTQADMAKLFGLMKETLADIGMQR